MEQKNEDWQVEFENTYRDWIQDSSIKSIKGFFAPIIEEAEKWKEREVLGWVSQEVRHRELYYRDVYDKFCESETTNKTFLKELFAIKTELHDLGILLDSRLAALEGKEYGTKE